jgi:hypothetical protein
MKTQHPHLDVPDLHLLQTTSSLLHPHIQAISRPGTKAATLSASSARSECLALGRRIWLTDTGRRIERR